MDRSDEQETTRNKVVCTTLHSPVSPVLPVVQSIARPPMSWQELGEDILWFCLSVAITVIGGFAALVAMMLCYFRGTRAGRPAAFCVILAILAAVALWLIFVFIDPPAAMVLAAGMSLAAFVSVGSWLSRYDR